MHRDRDALPEGTRLAGYVIRRQLGKRGGFGITYLATKYINEEEKFAIKEFLPRGYAMRVPGAKMVHADDPNEFQQALASLEAEAWTLKELRHRNVAEVQDFLNENGTAYLVMKYEEGMSLADLLERERILSEERIRSLLPPLLEGLEAVHDKGYLHRDIKPGNIYVRSADGSTVLLDFGAARRVTSNRSESRITLIYTPGFAPPEQYVPTAKLGPPTDIYALGATLYYCMTGAVPPESVVRDHDIQHGDGDPLTPIERAAAGRFSASLFVVVRQSLTLEATARPQSVAELRDILGLAPRYQHSVPKITADRLVRGRTVSAALITGVFLALPALLPFLFFAPPLWDLDFQLRPYLLVSAATTLVALIAFAPPFFFVSAAVSAEQRGLLRQRRAIALVICGFALALTSLAILSARDPNIHFSSDRERLYNFIVPLSALLILVGIPAALVVAGRRRFGLWLAIGATIAGVLAAFFWLNVALASGRDWVSELLTLPISLNGLFLGSLVIGLAVFPLLSRPVRRLRRDRTVPSLPERGMALTCGATALTLVVAAVWIPWLPGQTH